jgi:hypothetical protein
LRCCWFHPWFHRWRHQWKRWRTKGCPWKHHQEGRRRQEGRDAGG